MWHVYFRAKRARAVRRGESVTHRETVVDRAERSAIGERDRADRATASGGWEVGFLAIMVEGPS